MNDDHAVLTTREVADLLRIHISSIYRLIKRDSFPYFKTGGDYRFRRDAVDKWVERRTVSRDKENVKR